VTRVIVCCDGLDPKYLEATETPGWDAIAAEGRAGCYECSLPSLRNVNNVSIVTGGSPEAHGITGNTLLRPRARRGSC
jgi:phosphonoacetate hydrolase